MIRPTCHRRLLAGILLFALMLQSLLPAIAGTVSGGTERWIEVCAKSGVKWVKLELAKADPARQDSQTVLGDHAADGHCLLCAAGGVPPDFDVRRYLHAQAVDALPSLPGLAAPAVFPGHALHSRAPPLYS